METTIVTTLAAVAGTMIAFVAFVTRSLGRMRTEIGRLRTDMIQRIDALIHANQQAHDAIGLRIDAQGAELRERIDAQGGRIDAQSTALGGRIDAQGAELRERIDAQGAELRERIDAQGAALAGRIDAQSADLGGRIDAQGRRLEKLEDRLAETSGHVQFIRGVIKGWVGKGMDDD